MAVAGVAEWVVFNNPQEKKMCRTEAVTRGNQGGVLGLDLDRPKEAKRAGSRMQWKALLVEFATKTAAAATESISTRNDDNEWLDCARKTRKKNNDVQLQWETTSIPRRIPPQKD